MSIKISPKKCVIIISLVLVSIGKSVNADFVFGTPTKLGPNIKGSPSITADNLEAYFEYRGTGTYGNGDIYMSRRAMVGDPWGQAENLGTSVNGSTHESAPSISADGLALYFYSNRGGGPDIWLTTRATRDDPWDTPIKLEPPVNIKAQEFSPSISATGLSLYFASKRSGGFGQYDLWFTARATMDDPWGTPVNLGPTINSSYHEAFPSISADERLLFFSDYMGGPFRPGGQGGQDLWLATRTTKDDSWAEAVNLGPIVNGPGWDFGPSISPDGSTLYFHSDRDGPGFLNGGPIDVWEAPILPVVDFNADGIVDSADIVIMVDRWGTDDSLCDIGPMPWGDGIVDVEDLIILAEHLFEEF